MDKPFECKVFGVNHFVIKDKKGNLYCFSYGENVASVINGEYIEYQGDKYYSKTSVTHKNRFKAYYGIGG